MAAKFKVGDVVLHKDGQYECEVVQVMDGTKPSYRLKDLSQNMTFTEYESYLLPNEEQTA